MGEDIACDFLKEKGHRILERNWRSGHLEVDIISLASDGLHFVEVKSRVAPVSALPEENVGPTKQKKIAAAANRYLHSKDFYELCGDFETHFDVFSVIFEGERTEVTYFPDAYIPIYT